MEQGRESNRDIGNLSFHKASVYETAEFVREQGLEGKVDLIIMGECFHWFDAPKALAILHEVAS